MRSGSECGVGGHGEGGGGVWACGRGVGDCFCSKQKKAYEVLKSVVG